MSITTADVTLAKRASALEALQEEIRACRRCQDAGYLPVARPVRDVGRSTDRIMVIGQAPGALTDSARRPFTGPAGTTLERWFSRAGFPSSYFREQVYLTAVTRCFPGKSMVGKGDRMPSRAEQTLCRPFLQRELALVQPQLVLLVGTLAIAAFLGKVKLAEVVGTAEVRDGRTFLPMPHSSPVSRWLNDAENRRRVEQGIQLLAEYRVSLGLG